MFPALAAGCCVAIVACGDVTSPRAALPTFSDSASGYALNGAPRPKEFKSTEGSDHVFTIYKRKAK